MTVEEKAERLLLTGRVTIHGGYTATVRGDHDEYALIRMSNRWRCACPARKKCSHIEAVERVTG